MAVSEMKVVMALFTSCCQLQSLHSGCLSGGREEGRERTNLASGFLYAHLKMQVTPTEHDMTSIIFTLCTEKNLFDQEIYIFISIR